MAYLNICGWETGDNSEANGTAGTFSVQSTTKRTGTYALQVNPSAASGYHRFAKHGANAKTATLGAISTVYLTVYFRFATLPSGAAVEFLTVSYQPDGSNVIVEALVSSTGVVTIKGATTSATIATISTGTWYRLDLKAVQNGTCEGQIDGGTAQTCTGGNDSINYVIVGARSIVTFDAFYDDLAISNSAIPGAGQVNVMTVDGNGSVPGSWTDVPNNGAGNEYMSLDEIPHDSGTSYVATYNNANEVAYFTCISAATAGVAGTIGTVKTIGILAETTSLSTSGYIRTRSGTTNSDSTAVDVGNTSYVTFAKLNDTNPADSAAWESADLDGLNIGFGQGPDTSQIRCTLLCAMVWNEGSTPTTGTSVLVLNNVTLAGSGKQKQTGTAVLTFNNVSAAASGSQKQTGASVLVLPNVTMAATSTQAQLATSVLTLPNVTLSATGVAGFQGIAVLVLPNVTLAATGYAVPTGAAVLALPNITLAGVGSQTYSGTSILVLPNVTMAGSGTQKYSGTSILTLPNVFLAGSGTQGYQGTSILTLPRVSLVGAGIQSITGTVVLTLPGITLAATGFMFVNHGPLYVQSELVYDFPVLISELDFPNYISNLDFPNNNLNLEFPYHILSHKFPRNDYGY